MRKGRMERNIAAMLYDRQISGKKFKTVKKSFQEVVQVLQSERKK